MTLVRNTVFSSRNMAFVSFRSTLRILWTAVAALVLLTRSSAAPAFGMADKATVSFFKYYLFILVKVIKKKYIYLYLAEFL